MGLLIVFAVDNSLNDDLFALTGKNVSRLNTVPAYACYDIACSVIIHAFNLMFSKFFPAVYANQYATLATSVLLPNPWVDIFCHFKPYSLSMTEKPKYTREGGKSTVVGASSKLNQPFLSPTKRFSKSITSTKRWKSLRVRALRRDGFKCVACGAQGRLEVDHIKPVRTHPELAYDLENLQCLCASCHAKKTRVECGHPQPSPQRLAWQYAVQQITEKRKEKRHASVCEYRSAAIGDPPTTC